MPDEPSASTAAVLAVAAPTLRLDRAGLKSPVLLASPKGGRDLCGDTTIASFNEVSENACPAGVAEWQTHQI
jgi:hypothetical protein